jgi:hypothetical protein
MQRGAAARIGQRPPFSRLCPEPAATRQIGVEGGRAERLAMHIERLLLEARAAGTCQIMELVDLSNDEGRRRKLRLASDGPIRIRKTFDLPDEEPADLEAHAKVLAAEFVALHRATIR